MAKRSDATGIRQVNNLRILKGFTTDPSFIDFQGKRRAIPLGSMNVFKTTSGGPEAIPLFSTQQNPSRRSEAGQLCDDFIT